MQSSAANTFTPSKLKYIVIFVFILILGIIIFKMLQFEDSIREQRIIKIKVGEENKKLIPDISKQELKKLSENSQIGFIAGNKYISVLETKIKNGETLKEWRTHFVKGVNMGVALPGCYPSEFKASMETYLDWFKKIAEMNSNTVRTYTILPPEFYEAFAQYNVMNANHPLYLIQGVWADEADSNNYLEENYVRKFELEIKDVIDVIHGNAVIKERPGHAAGVYVRDVSLNTMAILLGREWEPQSVTSTNKKNKITSFTGNFISMPRGNSMEVWLARMMDFTIQYETQFYEAQRPVSFVNWLPTDPMYHNSEFIESKKIREYDNDIEFIDFRNFYTTDLFNAGIFASYHAYPYYPDYIYLDEKYKNSVNANGEKDNYFGYLQDLKKYCPGMPLLITEYGVPSSRGNSHYSPFGFHQGGHSEEEQARINKILTEDIYNTGCGGAVYFEWMDEWFKFNWLVLDFEVPASRRKLWHNMENPEQNFGAVAIEQRTKVIDGFEQDWQEREKISDKNNYSFYSGADAEYFYIKYKLSNFDFSKNNFYIALDTYDKVKGDHKIPFLNGNIERGAEFLINFINKDSAEMLVDDKYSVYSDIYNDYIPVYSSKENYDGKFVRQYLLSNRERASLTGEKTERTEHDRSGLIYGKSDEYAASNSNWMWNENEKILELRLPWHLLNVSDPSSRSVLNDIEGTPDIESSQTEGFYVYAFVTDKDNQNVKQIPGNDPDFVSWNKWETPEYKMRFKKTYFMFQELFSKLDADSGDAQSEVKQEFKIAKWYDNKDGAVTISFDDGTMSQYLEGLPVMEKYRITGTFALVTDWTHDNPSSSAEKGSFEVEKFGWKQAREISDKGNEIASHNFFHIKMDTMSSERAFKQMSDSKIITERNLGKPVYTFVFPYSATRSEFYKIASDAGYLFARTGEESINHDDNINLSKLTTLAVYAEEIPTMSELQTYLLEAKDKWLILNYHNIFHSGSKEMNLMKYHNVVTTYSVTPEMFDKQMRLVRNSGYWIAPISTVGRYIKESRNAKIETTEHDNKIFLKVVNSLDDAIYNVPLTIEFTTNWKVLRVTNSEADGIYNTRNGMILINLLPGKEVLIENLKK